MCQTNCLQKVPIGDVEIKFKNTSFFFKRVLGVVYYILVSLSYAINVRCMPITQF